MNKLLLVLALGVTLFASCEEEDRACPVVTSESIPQAVKDAQDSHYPGLSVEIWYNTDNKGYCAQFLNVSTTIYAFYDNDGNFLDENDEGENENSEDQCECGDDD